MSSSIKSGTIAAKEEEIVSCTYLIALGAQV